MYYGYLLNCALPPCINDYSICKHLVHNQQFRETQKAPVMLYSKYFKYFKKYNCKPNFLKEFNCS